MDNHVNRLILPMELENDKPVNIMWSSTKDLPDEHWVANHFVNFLPLYHRTEAKIPIFHHCVILIEIIILDKR